NQAQNAQDPQGPEYRQMAGGGHESDSDHQEIEDVPGVPGKLPAIEQDLDRKLDYENRKDDPVERLQEPAGKLHRRCTGLEPQRNGIEHDEQDDDLLGGSVFEQ